MLNAIRRKLRSEWGEEYNLARELAEENAYLRLDEHNPMILMRLSQAIEAGADPDIFAQRFLQEAGQHRREMAKDLGNAGRYIKRMMDDEIDPTVTYQPAERGA